MVLKTGNWSDAYIFSVTSSGSGSGGGTVGPVDPGALYSETNKLYALDEEAMDRFGFSSAISADGNILVVGAPQDKYNGSLDGSVYIYRRSSETWVQIQKIAASSVYGLSVESEFGYSVDIDDYGYRIVVGSPGREPTGGGAVIYYRGDDGLYAYEGEISVTSPGARLGHTVSMSRAGDRIAVSAPQEPDSNSVVSGAVYVYARNGLKQWNVESKIYGPGTEKLRGYDLALSDEGDFLAVANVDTATVFVLHREVISGAETWVHKTKFTHSVITDGFGTSVDITDAGDRIIVGSPSQSTNQNVVENKSGVIHVYLRSDDFGASWSKEAEIMGADTRAISRMGCSLAINTNGSKIVAGAENTYYDTSSNPGVGSAYVFKRAGNIWTQDGVLKRSDYSNTLNKNRFGNNICIADMGNLVVVGTPIDTDRGIQSGSVYIYKLGEYVDNTEVLKYITALPDPSGLNSTESVGPTKSIATSADGSTVVVGDPTDGTGSVSCYKVSNGIYSLSEKLVASSTIGGTEQVNGFGRNVAITDDGSKLLVLSNVEVYPSDWDFVNPVAGGANQTGNVLRIYTRQASGLYQLTKSIASLSYPSFNGPIAISGDGLTLVNAREVFTYNGAQWNHQAQLKVVNSSGGDYDLALGVLINGKKAALSYDGSTLLYSGGYATSQAKWEDFHLFKRIGVTWGPCVTKTQAVQNDTLMIGADNALSANGDLVVIPRCPNNGQLLKGSVSIYRFDGTALTLEATIDDPDADIDTYGYSVTMNGSGTILAVSSPREKVQDDGTIYETQVGKVYLYTKSNNTWSLKATLQPHNNNVFIPHLWGTYIRLNKDGNRLFVTKPETNKVVIYGVSVV